jgi:hypothetical protein
MSSSFEGYHGYAPSYWAYIGALRVTTPSFRGELTTMLQHLLRATLEKALTLALVQG